MCGFVGDFISGLFGGGGGGSSYSAPEVQKVDPTITNVTSSDVGSTGSSESEANRKQRAKKGYTATRLAANKLTSIAGQAASGSRSTLG